MCSVCVSIIGKVCVHVKCVSVLSGRFVYVLSMCQYNGAGLYIC